MTTFTNDFSKEIWDITYKYHEDETVDDTFKRVSKFLASIEDDKEYWENEFYNILSDFKVTLGGRIYSNAGTNYDGATSINCFVSPRNKRHLPLDSLDGIFETALDLAQTLKSEGGDGNNYSFIRPRGAKIKKIGIDTPGAVKYLEIYDKISDIITSGSGLEQSDKKSKKKIRKGAMMAVLDVWHPDIEEFITIKQNPEKLTKFNLSVNCTKEFMNAVQNNLEWKLEFPDTTFKNYDDEWDGDLRKWKFKNYPVKIYKTVNAKELFNLITKSTYEKNEPGILFLDRANEKNPGYYHEKIIATNPCGEQTLPESGVCNLGSLNITQCLNNNNTDIDYNKVSHYTKVLVRMLDNVNSLSNTPLQEYKDSMENDRRVGCGIVGFSSALYLLGIKYGSEESIELINKLMKFYAQELYKASIDLAIEKGMYSKCIPEKHLEGTFINSLDLSEEYLEKLLDTGIRNCRLLSIQPTGNTAVFANIISGGLEPIFMKEYIRTYILHEVPKNIKDKVPKYWEGQFEENDWFKFIQEGHDKLLKATIDGETYKIDKNRGLTKEVLCEDYAVKILKDKYGDNWYNENIHVTTENLTVQEHVNTLNAFSKWIDGATSKTINVPTDYPFEEFQNVYLDAYNLGNIVGVTTYRANTMMSVLSSTDKKDDNVKVSSEVERLNKVISNLESNLNDMIKLNNDLQAKINNEKSIKFVRPKQLNAKSIKEPNGCGNIWANLSYSDDNKLKETFFQMGRSGGCAASMLEGIGRLCSLILKYNIPKEEIIDQLSGILCPSPFLGGAKSCSDGIARVLSDVVIDKPKIEQPKYKKLSGNVTGTCPDCHGPLHYQEGCSVCYSCNFSKCS